MPRVVARPAAAKLGRRHHPPRTVRRRGPAGVAPQPGERTGVSRGLAGIAAASSAGTGGLSRPRPARRGRIRLALRQPRADGGARATGLGPGIARHRRRTVLATAAPRRKGPLCVGRPGQRGRLGGTAPGVPAARLLARPGGPLTVARSGRPVSVGRSGVVPAAPASPATAARWLWVSAPGVRVALPERLLAAVAPAEQPALAAALVGNLLQHAVQPVQVRHQAAAALRRLAAVRRLAGSFPVRAAPARTRPVVARPVRTVPGGAAPPGTGSPAVAAFCWFGLDGAGDDSPAGSFLAIRIRGLPGRAGWASDKRAPGRLRGRGTPPRAVLARRPRRRVPAAGIPAS